MQIDELWCLSHSTTPIATASNMFPVHPCPSFQQCPTESVDCQSWLMTHTFHALFMLSSCFSCHGLHHRPWAHRQGPFQQNASPALQALPDPRSQLDNQGAWTGLVHLGARGYVSRIGVHWRLWRTWAWCGFVHLDWRFGHQSLCAQNECCATWKNVQCLTRNQHLRACSILLHLLLLQVNFVNFSVLKLSSALLFGDAALRALPRAEPHQVPQNRQRLSFWSIWSIWSIWSSWSCSVGMLQNRLMEPNWPT